MLPIGNDFVLVCVERNVSMSIDSSKAAQRSVGFKPGGDRPKGDFYPTHTSTVQALLNNEKFGPNVLEPCCGKGDVSRCLESNGYNVTSRDLHDWGFGDVGLNFLETPSDEKWDAIITNPPFNLSMEFAYKALELTKHNNGKVALLNRLQWLEGVKRNPLFTHQPLSRVLVFTKRIPMMSRYDFEEKPTSSMICFAWFIWDWTYEGKPTIGWI